MRQRPVVSGSRVSLSSKDHKGPWFARPIVKAATVFNIGFLASALAVILVGAVDQYGRPPETLTVPGGFAWTWLCVLPITLAVALILNRKTQWQWARHVNWVIVAIWSTSVAFYGGVI